MIHFKLVAAKFVLAKDLQKTKATEGFSVAFVLNFRPDLRIAIPVG
jgi:hypothetical protein